MTTNSYPAVGKNGFTEVDWSAFFNAHDGVVESYTNEGFTLALTRPNDTTIRIGLGSARLNGFQLDVTDPQDLNCPTVTTATTYYVGVQYDPALNVADGDGNANAIGPCRLIITTTVDATGGKSFLLLYSFTRAANQALSTVVITPHLKYQGGPSVDWPQSLGDPPVGQFAQPRGTLRYANDTKQILVRTVDDSGTLSWNNAFNFGPFPLPLASSLVAQAGTGTTPQYVRYSGNRISFEGRVARSNGNRLSTGSTVVLGTMPAGQRPQFVQSFICRCSGVGNQVEVRINADGTTNGQILMTDPADPCDWVDLSGIDYRIGA